MTFNKVTVSGPGFKEGEGLCFLGFAFADVRLSHVTALGNTCAHNLSAEDEG